MCRMRFFSPAILQPYRAELNTSIVTASHHGLVPGCAALGAHVAEVPSIAVRPEARGLKAGSKLLPT
jgi:N-acetylglutamate synthase-like GNAT family acetyltransferase